MAERGDVRREERSAAWRRYYAATGASAPRKTLVFALDRFDAGPPLSAAARRAVDLGCGAGRDTVALLARGWRVLAIDAEPAAIAALRARRDLPASAELETRVARFEEAQWGARSLVNASFTLPLAPPEKFAAMWPRLVASLTPGGRLACQLFGDRDGWRGDGSIAFHSRAEAEALLAPFDVEMLEEEEADSVTPRDAAKHWHLFHIVARKPAPV